MKIRAIFFVAMVVLISCTKAVAATYSFEPIADSRVLGLSGDQTVNYSSDILSVFVSTATANTQRTFIQFDLSSIANGHVDSATLTLNTSTEFGNNSAQKPMEIYRVLSPWTETGVTWLKRDATHAWGTNGGDFVGTNGQPYAVSTAVGANNQPITWDVTTLVQEWVAQVSTNNGLALLSYNGNSLTFSQREIGAPALRPHLTVVVADLPPVHAYSSGAQIVLWWPTTNSVLQEKTNLNPAVAWADSVRLVVQSNGTNSVTISAPSGNNFFRLRKGP